jgi:hypothetical protein
LLIFSKFERDGCTDVISSLDRLISIGLMLFSFSMEVLIALLIRIFSRSMEKILKIINPNKKSNRICVFAARMTAAVWSFS